jgi:hydroxyacylglutathione hydrolase
MQAIADEVWQLPLLPRNAINAYLIGDVLVDTGVRQSAGKIAEMLKGRTIAAIALTHAHGDHAGSMKRLASQWGVPVWCGAADSEAAETGRPVLSRLVDKPGLSTLANATSGFEAASIARALTEGDALAAGFTVLDTPGHSPGHVSFWRETDRTLICGDVFFNMHLMTTVPGLRQPPRLFTPDPARNRESERRLATLEPQVAGFGHGPVLSSAAPRMHEFIAALPPD